MHAADQSETTLACQTLHFYDTNAVRYAEQTRGIDLAHLYGPFLAKIPRAGKILDVGCGAGRDLKKFVAEGFEAIGLDPSKKLAIMAREFSGCEVLASDVRDISFEREFDGVWACASLIHLPQRQLPVALERIFSALRPRGVLFVSMQVGNGEAVLEDGRFVARYTSEELSEVIKQARFEHPAVWITPDSLRDRHSVVWVNAIARKPSEPS